MTDYDAMYCRLFRGVTEAIIALQKAQQEAEDIYMDTCCLETECGQEDEPARANCVRPQKAASAAAER